MHFFSQECSAASISLGITDNLFRLLKGHIAITDPTSSSNDNDVITSENQALELAVACLVKIIHLIHHADVKNQHQVC